MKIPKIKYGVPRIVTNGAWYTNEDETGMKLYHEEVPIIDKKGKIIEFGFADAQAFTQTQTGLDIAGYPVSQVTTGAGIK